MIALLWALVAGAQEEAPVPPKTPDVAAEVADEVALGPHGDHVWGDGHATLLIGADGGVGPGLGGGVAIGRAPVLFELRTDLAAVPGGPRFALWPAVRLHLVDVHRAGRWRPSIHGGIGLQAGLPDGATRDLVLGGDLDTNHPSSLFRSEFLRPRFGVWTETDLQGRWFVGAKIGVVWASGGRPQPVPVEPVDEAPVEEPPAVVEPEVPAGGEGPWWDPDACEWVDSDPGNGWRPQDGVGIPGADGNGQGGLAAGAGSGRQGWLVVVAQPGSVVKLPGIEQQIGPEGAVRLAAPEGVVEVEVVGGGRTQAFEAAIADGFVLWLRAQPPDEVAVLFPSGSAAIDEADRVAAQALARNRGQYHLQLTGSFSPEGNRAYNLELANRRAEAVKALLVEVGVPPEDVEVLPPTPPRDGLTVAQQRAVYVTPVSPPEGR